MSEFKHTEEILHLYKAPFKYDGMGYIWDANGKMIADSIGESVPAFAQVRGWGYLTGMGQGGSAIPHDIAEEIQDEITPRYRHYATNLSIKNCPNYLD